MALKGGETCERGQLMIYSLLLSKKVFGSSSVNSIHDLSMAACYVYSNNDVFSLTHSPFLKACFYILLILPSLTTTGQGPQPLFPSLEPIKYEVHDQTTFISVSPRDSSHGYTGCRPDPIVESLV